MFRYCMYRAMASFVGRFQDFHVEMQARPLQREGSVWAQDAWNKWDAEVRADDSLTSRLTQPVLLFGR